MSKTKRARRRRRIKEDEEEVRSRRIIWRRPILLRLSCSTGF
jgi:hypothetical protein